MIDGRRFEDIAVGQVFEHGEIAVTEESVIAFARQFDPQIFHLDAEAAKDTFFAGLAASGWHTAAMTMRLIVESGLQLAGGIIGAGGSLTWPKPTRPGDVLSIRIEVLELRASRTRPERGTLKARVTTRNQHGDELQIMTCDLLVWRRHLAN
ncbi:MAG: MaoC family dehydratase [Alphaproteobacteria bacterium]|nr:MaoC family dehydratase [Alphaproteobacteria bacterium]